MIGDGTRGIVGAFQTYCKQHSLSFTPQRRIVLEQILSGPAHFDVEHLVEQIHAHQQAVSRATVYRTVAHLEAAGFLRRIDFNHAHAHYECDAGLQHHEHLICEQCGAVMEFTDVPLERGIQEAAARHSFEMTRHTVQIFGRCGACRE